MEPEVHIKKVPRNEKVSSKYFLLTSKQSCTYRFNHSEEDVCLDCSVVSSLVLVSHLLTLGTGDVAVGPASDTVIRAITS